MSFKSLLRTVLMVVAMLGAAATYATDWLQFGYDAAHSSDNPDETTISSANVALLSRKYQVTLAASVDSAPVYASAIVTPSGTRNLLFVNSTNGKLIAIDADDGSLVWSQSTSSGTTQSSPAIDPDRAFVYSYGNGNVHKYAIGDGTEITTDGWPQVATLKPNVEKGASALAIAPSASATYLYAVTDGYIGDGGDYQGHITTIDLATGTQTVFNTLCSDITIHMVQNACSERQSGIWGRPGATYDADTDRVYITTGNGTFNANTGGFDWGDSVLALHADGTGGDVTGLPLDSYTPTNYAQLDGSDIDLGSASLSILPVPPGSTVANLGLQTGKDSILRLIDLDDMSGTGAPGGVGGEIELISVPNFDFWMTTQPAIWVDRSGDGATWIYMANGAGISGLKLGLDGASEPHLQPTWQKNSDATSAIIANGVVYHAGSCNNSTCIIARDPHDGSVLWTSQPIGNLHWQSPIVVDGALYIAVGTSLQRFDLGGGPTTHIVTPLAGANGSITPDAPQTVDDGATTQFAITADAHYTIADVTGCGGTLAGNTYTTGPISADCTVNATFAIVTHIVTPLAGTHGSITPGTAQTIDDGATTSFTITPDPNYAIADVTGCDGHLVDTIYTTAPIGADCTVNATFVVADTDVIFRDGFDPGTD
jgi:hypothetical protein